MVENVNNIKKLNPYILAPTMAGIFVFLAARAVRIGILIIPNKMPNAWMKLCTISSLILKPVSFVFGVTILFLIYRIYVLKIRDSLTWFGDKKNCL